jgi:hypothetical protein
MGVHLLHSIRLFVALATAVGLIVVLPASSVSAAETKTFTGVKDCRVTPSPPDPGGFCQITASNLKILLNAKMYYTAPQVDLIAGILTSPITLVATDGRGSTATGRCTFYFDTVRGLCEFWSGTAKLLGFHAIIHVAGPIPDPNVYTLTGKYWFDRHHDDD